MDDGDTCYAISSENLKMGWIQEWLELEASAYMGPFYYVQSIKPCVLLSDTRGGWCIIKCCKTQYLVITINMPFVYVK